MSDFYDGVIEEVLEFGYIAVQKIAAHLGRTKGRMQCPLCRRKLIYWTDEKGVFNASCRSKHCIQRCNLDGQETR